MTSRIGFLALRCAMLLTTGALALSPVFAQDQGINVVINQAPVAFSGSPPREMNGSVLVPLRGVFEKLGASVDYNSATQQIQSKKGNTLVVLTIGQRTAFVNGSPQSLSQPAMVVNGTTLVPLRFVAQSFGADVAWLPSTKTVEIKTADQHVSGLPAPPTGRLGNVVGTLTGVYPNTDPPQITLRVNGQNTSVPFSPDTVVLVQQGSQAATQQSVSDLKIGDQVHVTVDPDTRAATVIRLTYGELVGTVKSVTPLPDGSAVITLNDGQSRQIAPDAAVTMAGRAIRLADILPSERVVIRTDPSSKIAYAVDVPAGYPAPSNQSQGGETPNAGPLSISSFTVNAPQALHAGDTVSATLQGTPGQHATASIPGVVDKIQLPETSPGTYAGSFRIPANVNVQGGSVLAQLTSPTNPSASSPMIQAAQTVTVDTKPPVISGMSPAPGSSVATNRPRIYAVTDDPNGTGVDPTGTRLILDARNITPDALVTAGFVTYQPNEPLSPGMHDIGVQARDLAGNISGKHWKFTVSTQSGIVSGLSSNITADNNTLSSGQPLTLTLRAQPGGSAQFDVGSIARNIPMHETQPGVYTGAYTPAAGSSVQNAPVVARFTAPNGALVTSTLDQSVSIAAGAPQTPVVASPAPDAAVGNSVTISGTAAPGATVNISISYAAKALGLFGITGKAADAQAIADNRGRWSVGPVQLASPSALASARDLTYTLSATTVDANGQQSDPATVTFRHG